MAATFDDYMRSYHDDHQNKLNRLTHLFGIPMIVASLGVMPFRPKAGLQLFAAGWALQFLGHYFEGKPPSFVSRDWKYLAIGPVWIANEWVELATGARLYTPPPASAAAPAA